MPVSHRDCNFPAIRLQLRLRVVFGVHKLAPGPQGPAVNGDGGAVDVGTGAAGEVDDDAGNVFGATEAAGGVLAGVALEAAGLLEQTSSHLSREPAGADRVNEDVARAEVDGEIARQVHGSGLRGAIGEGGLSAEAADAEAGGGLMVAVVQCSIAVGSTLGGALYDHGGHGSTFTASAGVLGVAAVLAWRTAAGQRRLSPHVTRSQSEPA